MDYYHIIGIIKNHHPSGKIFARIQALGSQTTFEQPISELYQNGLAQFSPADAMHIAALYAAENSNNVDLIKRLPEVNPVFKNSVIIVGILFSAFLILSNLAAFKLATLGSFVFPAGLIFFPITYIFDDILTEVYGFKISRRIIWSALFANSIVLIGAWLTTYLTPAPNWHEQTAYASVYQATPRIFIASTLAYFFGEFANSIILAKLKILMSGRHLWLRALASTSVGVGIDTILFIHIAFLFIVPYQALWKITLSMYLVKVIYEVCAIPLTYKITHYLKHKDNVDHYDVNTKFNPFSLAI